MSSDADSKRSDQDVPEAVPSDRAGSPVSRSVPLRTMELCGWGMLLVGSGMPFAVDEEWWVWLPIAGMVVLMLFMAMVQERWLVRERHRLIVSALKRTGAPEGSGRSKEKASRRTRTRRGGKPVEIGSSRRAEGEPAKLGDGAVPPDPLRAPDGDIL